MITVVIMQPSGCNPINMGESNFLDHVCVPACSYARFCSCVPSLTLCLCISIVEYNGKENVELAIFIEYNGRENMFRRVIYKF